MRNANMSHALDPRPVRSSAISLVNHQYLSQGARADATMVWGTDVDAEGLSSFISKSNQSSRVLISVAHVLIRAVAYSLARFPQLNCRIIRGRIYRFRDVNVRLVSYDPRTADVDILTIKQADQTGLEEIGQFLWSSRLEIAAGNHSDCGDKAALNRGPAFVRRWGSRFFWWLDRNFQLPRLGRLDRHLDSAVVVNYLGFQGAPSMRMYKPSKFPDESSLLSVTLGRIEERAVVREGCVVARRVAPLFVRADHRVTDAYVLGRFIGTLQAALAEPQTMEVRSGDGQSILNNAA
jgi:hypothetical protein